MILASAPLVLAACGGGDDATVLVPAASPPFIAVSLSSSSVPLSRPPRTLVFASAQVLDQSLAGSPISNATITVNGTALTFDAASGRYSASLDAAPGATMTINVAAKGANYTAATTLLSGAPTMTSPGLFGATWSAAIDNLIQWSNAPNSDATEFNVAVLSLGAAPTPIATQVWPAGGQPQSVLSGATSVTVPRNSLGPCNCLVALFASRTTSFPGAAASSIVAVGASSSAAVTVN